MPKPPKKVYYENVDEAALCRSDGTIIPPAYKYPIRTSRPVLVFSESGPVSEEVSESDEQPEAEGEPDAR